MIYSLAGKYNAYDIPLRGPISNMSKTDPPHSFKVIWSRSYKTFFLHFYFIFDVKLGHFTINCFFLNVTNTQAYQQKSEKIFVSEENSFIGSATGSNIIKQIYNLICLKFIESAFLYFKLNLL
jgi:hypothetical protein